MTDPSSRMIESRIENCWTPSRSRGTIRCPFFLPLPRPRLTGPQGLPDPFKTSDEFVHCHDPRCTADVLYVSDSSRAWRDDNLLRWLHADPSTSTRGLQLLTHSEVWYAGQISDRLQYADEVLLPLAAAEVTDFISGELRGIWKTHEGALMHDARERARPQSDS